LISANQIREEFLQFFYEKGHTLLPSASLIPHNDPTLIFANAGMNQFKDVFLGKGTREYQRAADAQKCIRVSGKHNDLEEVGRDTYHHTFFEMLGNWSFGDYYKKEAITWAWELLTQKWQLPKEKLYATVYQSDDEAAALWESCTDIASEHIMRFGEKDNFWEMGETGPCGPCSEIHIDLGAERCDKSHLRGHVCGVNQGCARYIELWNLVFIQFNRQVDGSLIELPSKHVDTGMGFERIVSVLQKEHSNYDIDLFRAIIKAIELVTKQSYAKVENQVPMRVIADHIRSLTFAIADGALPSNEGRGYVLRRILRRAARFGRTLGMTEPFLYQIVEPLKEVMGGAYPELKEKQVHCEKVIRAEEEGFNRTLDKGIELFEEIAANLKRAGEKIISGKEAFKLYDTYGFPLDLTELMAEEHSLTVDVTGFTQEMEEQRQRGQASGRFVMTEEQAQWEVLQAGANSRFLGYETNETEAKLIQVSINQDYDYLVFDQTPFYGESGGQVGDTGLIIANGHEYRVVDTKRQQDLIVHQVKKNGKFPQNLASYTLVVDQKRRLAIASNHSATHLLQAALRKVLGAHLHQAGSLVTAEKLRFDFTHFEKISEAQLTQIEELVNQVVVKGLPVNTLETSYQEAVAQGATALFGEKYTSNVRMVKMSDFSCELCGGTHVGNTVQIRVFRIISESSVATGLRRIEAITGTEAIKVYQQERYLLNELSQMLKTDQAQLVGKLGNLLEEHQKLQKELNKNSQDQAMQELKQIFTLIKEANGVKYLVARVDGFTMELLREAIDKARDLMGSGVALLGSVTDGKVNFVAGVTQDLTKRVQAGNLVKTVAPVTGGSGGGRPDMAQAGGKEPAKLDEALKTGEKLICQLLA